MRVRSEKPIAQSIEGKKGKTFADYSIMFFQNGLEDSEACSFKPGDNALIYERDTAAGISYQCNQTTKGSGLYCSPLSFSRPISMTQNNYDQGGSTMLSHKNTKNANFLFVVDMQ